MDMPQTILLWSGTVFLLSVLSVIEGGIDSFVWRITETRKHPYSMLSTRSWHSTSVFWLQFIEHLLVIIFCALALLLFLASRAVPLHKALSVLVLLPYLKQVRVLAFRYEADHPLFSGSLIRAIRIPLKFPLFMIGRWPIVSQAVSKRRGWYIVEFKELSGGWGYFFGLTSLFISTVIFLKGAI
jgi:membrane-associated HD superfamily phosphohydrolase